MTHRRFHSVRTPALFVAGPDAAIAYAEEYRLGLVIVDEEGRTRIVPGPEGASWRIDGVTDDD